jgi:FtsH-binding integral membrane protein
MGCPNFIGYTYLHLFLASFASVAAAQLNLVKRAGIDVSNLTVDIGLFIAIIVLLVSTLFMTPGPLKYLVFLTFVILVGTSLRKVVERFKGKDVLIDVLFSMAGIFFTMTVAGFMDQQNTLGFGMYLLASLTGLILTRIILGVTEKGKDGDKKSMTSYILSFIGALIFSIYIAYDTQVLKEEAKACKSHPDYIDASLGLYLDILNLFVNLGDSAGK